MIVITLSDCPQKLRGDISKWLFEINTGVYVGNLNARVREALWLRICENLSTGRATMVYSSEGEQHLNFLVHNTTWECVDLDGIKLMRRPLSISHQQNYEKRPFVSKAGNRQNIRKIEMAHQKKLASVNYTVIAINTTGVNPSGDYIVEVAAIKASNGKPISKFLEIICTKETLPESIHTQTGISKETLEEQGRDLQTVMGEFLDYIGKDKVIGHNIALVYAFIRTACKKAGLCALTNPCIDTQQLARKRLKHIKDFRLQTVAKYFEIEINQTRRALDDCETTLKIYHKLIEECIG